MITVETSTVPYLECLMNSLQMRLYIVMRYRAVFRFLFFSSYRTLLMTVNEDFSPSLSLSLSMHTYR